MVSSRRLAAWLSILVVSCLSQALADTAQRAELLTASQSEWVAKHGKVRLGVTRTDWPPFEFLAKDGRHTGITADYLVLLQERTGLQVEKVVFDDWSQAIAAVRAGRIDFLGSMSKTPERERFLAFTAPYVTNPSVIVTRKDRAEIRSLADLRGRTVAVETGYVAGDVLKARHPEVRLLHVKSTGDALLEVSFGRADAYIGDLIVSSWLLERNYLASLEVRGPAQLTSSDLRFAVRRQLPELVGVLDAGLASLTEDDHRQIRQRWVSSPSAAPEAQKKLALSAAERQWIAAHPVIRVGIDPNWDPLEFLDDNGVHSGLAAEYVRLMRERLGLNLVVVPAANWTETMDKARRREVDLIALITRTAAREQEFQFTKPYVEMPLIIVTRSNERFANDLQSLDGQTVAVIRGYFAEEYLALHHPKVLQLHVETVDEALEAVNRGYAAATIGSVATMGSKIQDRYLGKLKIAGAPGFLQQMGMGVRSDWPELTALLDKGLASISPQEHQALRQKWLAVRIEYGIDWREIVKYALPIGIAVLIVLAVILVANRRLQRQMAETERKDAALKVQLAFQQTLMDTIPSPILFKDADARIYGCNRAFEETLGTKREEMLGCTILEVPLFSEEVRQRLHADSMSLLGKPGAMVHGEVRYRPAGQEEKIFLYWKTAFQVADGSAGGLLTVLVDVSALKRLEQATREARDAADAANRAKSSFLATMSHEIRTPMNAVLGMLELLSLTRLEADQMQSLGIVRESAKSLLRIIDDILDFSKIEAGKLEIKPEAASIAEVVDSVHTIYSGVASSKNLLLRKSVDGRIAPALLADPLRLRQVLNNFVSNALKFTQEGEVEIRADLVDLQPGRQTLRLSVRDTGIGVSPENLKRLFEPFMQAEADTTRRFGGTGLGLSICRRLAELMGGEVTIQSTVGQGTTIAFQAAFPVADAADLPAAEAASAPGVQGALVGRRAAPTVAQAEAEGSLLLVADDHPVNRLLLVRQLNTMGYAAVSAEDGAAALELWKSGRFALLISDCHMPVMDGYELAREIRRLEAGNGAKRTPILACTANALQGEAEVCFAAGMDDYLPKPVEMRELMAKLDRWLPLPHDHGAIGPTSAAAASNDRGEEATTTPEVSPIEAGPLAEITGGDKAMEREVLMDFRKANQADAAMIHKDLGDRNADGVRRAAHRMKGASRMVGAKELAALCERLEKAGSSQDWDAMQALKPLVDEELRRLDRFFDKL